MPLKIVRNDITKIECDAVVNAANSSLLGGGGVDGAIHRAAGPELLAECRTLGGCKVGEAKITQGYNMPCRHIIHTVGPVWSGGNFGEEELLKSCYRNSLQLALESNCQSVAFPLISSGVYGYPKPDAFKVAVNTIYEFLEEHEMLVYVVVFDKKGYCIGEKFFADIEAYIDDNYVDEFMSHEYSRESRIMQERELQEQMLEYMSKAEFDRCSASLPPPPVAASVPMAAAMPMSMPREATPIEKDICCSVCASASSDLENVLLDLDESFSEMLLRKIDEKGMTDAQCYKRANIDRKLFSKLRSNPQYKPSKSTALAFAISLELSLAETEDLLKKAGFALSHSSKFDVIIEYFIKNKKYDIFEINEALFAFDQNLLGN